MSLPLLGGARKRKAPKADVKAEPAPAPAPDRFAVDDDTKRRFSSPMQRGRKEVAALLALLYMCTTNPPDRQHRLPSSTLSTVATKERVHGVSTRVHVGCESHRIDRVWAAEVGRVRQANIKLCTCRTTESEVERRESAR